MRSYIHLILLTITVISIDSCSDESSSKESTTLKHNTSMDCSFYDSVKFNNIYVANEQLCNQRGLPFTRFILEYPNNLLVTHPNNGTDHLSIKQIEGGIVLEELNIGSSTLTLKERDRGVNLIESLVNDMKSEFPFITINNINSKIFMNKQTPLFEGSINSDSINSPNYKGEYLIMMLLPIPEFDESLTVPIITFMASEKSEIHSFEDFQNKGTIASIWGTFRYLETRHSQNPADE